ncbi:hypothetical protein HNR01_004329 [Methylorubrum rhodesianum]|nr:hypothetical protein [Methylorubrum rhodesianum]
MTMSTVIPLFRPASARQGNWSQQELAEFYRVEAALLRAGFSIASEHGLSDEGEPWFVFCRPDGDALIHFAKIDGSYLIASEALDRPVRGTDFRTLIDQIARLHPHLLPIPATGTTLVVHPAALLAALVAAVALSLSSEDAHAGPLVPGGEGVSSPPTSQGSEPAQGLPQSKVGSGSGDRNTDRNQLEAIILSAMIFAAEAMAVDHRAVSAELNLDFADGVRNASGPTPQGDAAQASNVALGSGSGSVSVQPAVLTAQGSGANPDARPQPASDAISAASRADPAPPARAEFTGDAPKSPASQNHPLAPGFGSDIALTGTSAEASAAKSSGQQASTLGPSESAAPASDGLGPEASDQRAGSASTSIVEPASYSRPAASSDAGSGPARPAWAKDMPQTVTSRVPPPEASRDADDRGHGRPAETALGNGAEVDPTGPGNGRGEGVGRDRGSPAKAAAETHAPGEQAASGHSQSGGVGQGRGAPAEIATGNTPQSESARHGQGSVDSTGQDRGSSAMAAAGHGPSAEPAGRGQGQAGDRGQDRGAPAAASHEMRVEQTSPANDPVNTDGPDRASSPEGASGNAPQTAAAGGGNGHASGVAREVAAPAQAEASNSSPVEPSSRGGGHTGGGAQERSPLAEAAAGGNPQTVQTGPDEGHAGVPGQGSTPAESVVNDRPEAQKVGRAGGQENASDQGSRRPTEAASGNDPQVESTGSSNGQGHGSSLQAEAAAHREPGSSASSDGHGRPPSDANERGSTAQTEAAFPGTEQQADRGNGRSSASAERSDQEAPEAHGRGATDTASSHGKPETPGGAQSDAAPTTKDHALLDSDSAAHGSNKLSATERSGGVREPTDGAAPEHAAAADHASATADGSAQPPTSSPSEQARDHSIGHGSDHASNATVSEQTNGDMSDAKEHGSTPSDVAVTAPSNVHAGGTGPHPRLAQDESAPHGHSADAELATPAPAARDPVFQDRGSDRADAQSPLGHGASPASDAQVASPKSEHAQADPEAAHDDAGPVVVRAIPAADPQATAHGVDENSLSDPTGGPNLMSPSAPVSPGETASAHADREQVKGGPSVGGRADREAPGLAADPVKAKPPTEPPVQVEAGLADGPSPTGQSGSVASHGTSGQAKPGLPGPPPAAIDADGNLVFHSDAHQDPAPSALPVGPDEATTHHAVGLIGVSDQAHPAHDIYHHT